MGNKCIIVQDNTAAIFNISQTGEMKKMLDYSLERLGGTFWRDSKRIASRLIDGDLEVFGDNNDRVPYIRLYSEDTRKAVLLVLGEMK